MSTTTNTPTKWISAESWNGTVFYYNPVEDTWVMADTACLDAEFDAGEADFDAARACADRENFACRNMGLNDYTDEYH